MNIIETIESRRATKAFDTAATMSESEAAELIRLAKLSPLMPRNPNKPDWSGGLPACFTSFSIIDDPRTGGNKLHHFGEVLFMAISAMLCGMNTFSDIEDFCDLQADWLRKWIQMPNGVPRAQTFSNIFAIIEPDLFNRCLIEHVGNLHPTLKRQIIAIDG
jgi:hypothetical protein